MKDSCENSIHFFIVLIDCSLSSSNVNEVIKAVLNSLFFLQKDFTQTHTHKSTEAQRRNQAKAQNATSEQKLKCA